LSAQVAAEAAQLDDPAATLPEALHQTRERVAARLIAVRMPEAMLQKCCRQARPNAKKRCHTPF